MRRRVGRAADARGRRARRSGVVGRSDGLADVGELPLFGPRLTTLPLITKAVAAAAAARRAPCHAGGRRACAGGRAAKRRQLDRPELDDARRGPVVSRAGSARSDR